LPINGGPWANRACMALLRCGHTGESAIDLSNVMRPCKDCPSSDATHANPVELRTENPPASARRKPCSIDRPCRQGWHTSDDQEITLRRWRGRTEILSVKALEPDHPYFGTFRAQSASGGSYEVEIRSLKELSSSCGCIGYRVNGLGTCKHIAETAILRH
jgi:hypothetical protein